MASPCGVPSCEVGRPPGFVIPGRGSGVGGGMGNILRGSGFSERCTEGRCTDNNVRITDASVNATIIATMITRVVMDGAVGGEGMGRSEQENFRLGDGTSSGQPKPLRR